MWARAAARRFTIFVFVSMLAYSAQDLILEPFAGSVFGFTPGESTKLSGLQHAGVLVGMIVVAVRRERGWRPRIGLDAYVDVGGCIASAAALISLSMAAFAGPSWPLRASVFALGHSQRRVRCCGHRLDDESGRLGPRRREKVCGWACGARLRPSHSDWVGFVGTVASDLARYLFGSPHPPTRRCSPPRQYFSWSQQHWRCARSSPGGRTRCAAFPSTIDSRTQPTWVDDDDFDGNVSMSWSSEADRPAQPPRRDLARRGHSVLLLDRAGRIKPCGGAIPPRLIKEFEIPDSLLVARVTSGADGFACRRARSTCRSMAASSAWSIAKSSTNGCGNVRREPAQSGAPARSSGISRGADGVAIVDYRSRPRAETDEAAARARAHDHRCRRGELRGRAAGGAGCARMRYVFAYHEIVRSPKRRARQSPASSDVTTGNAADFDGARCDVYYQGHAVTRLLRLDLPARGHDQCGRAAPRTRAFPCATPWARCATVAGSMQPKRFDAKARRFRCVRCARWDNGRDVVLAGDAAGVVAPASGEGIYYAMAGGRLRRGSRRVAARRRETSAHCDPRASVSCRRTEGSSWCLGSCSASGTRTTSGVSDSSASAAIPTCSSSPGRPTCTRSWCGQSRMAHVRIFFKDLAHLVGLVPP